VWKWEHYLDIYHRHLQKFVGRDVTLLEVGVYSGGSLDMWKAYFGARCNVIGVDIEERCRAYEDADTRIFIGDQADRALWARVKHAVPALDIVIDDGGHDPAQQIVTLEELLPHLRPGGVYICEDVHGVHQRFAAYVAGLATQLNATIDVRGDVLAASPTPFQQAVRSVHHYPFVVVIERTDRTVAFVAPKRGSDWQPFYDTPTHSPASRS
jgi:hypothetical protein